MPSSLAPRVLLLALLLPVAQASAGDTLTLAVDCYDASESKCVASSSSEYDKDCSSTFDVYFNTYTRGSLTYRLYGSGSSSIATGEVRDNHQSKCDRDEDLYVDFSGQLNANWTKIRVTTTSTDAIWMDEVQIQGPYKDNILGVFGSANVLTSFGTDGGKGYCISNDAGDNDDFNDDGCFPCVDFYKNGDVKSCGTAVDSKEAEHEKAREVLMATYFDKKADSALSGLNHATYENQTAAQCANACFSVVPWCHSFDYTKATRRCDLSMSSWNSPAGVPARSSNAAYDHYVIKPAYVMTRSPPVAQ